MSTRFTKIDDLTRGDHTFIRPEDECFHLGEYMARQGFSAGTTNDLIQNLKKPMDRRGKPEWRYKEWAIGRCADMLVESFGASGFGAGTVVPVPPSKIVGDPAHDPRLEQILAKASASFDADVRPLIIQAQNMEPSHDGERASIKELTDNYRFNEALLTPFRKGTVFVFDDVLTTGRHFRAMKETILSRVPETRVIGIFMARRKIPKIDLTEIFADINL